MQMVRGRTFGRQYFPHAVQTKNLSFAVVEINTSTEIQVVFLLLRALTLNTNFWRTLHKDKHRVFQTLELSS